ncbi:MAG: hypothetical protein IPL35_02895 [Sphingobacteriales bacterium]|nr:hypothetical protein [Sphingobacteriales bacterium]
MKKTPNKIKPASTLATKGERLGWRSLKDAETIQLNSGSIRGKYLSKKDLKQQSITTPTQHLVP